MSAAAGAAPFEGTESLRVPHEWRVLVMSIVCIVVAAPLLGYVFPSLASIKEVALLTIFAMLYVTFARGRLIGGSIRVHPGQFGHVHEIVVECARALRTSTPNVFVRDDPLVPLVAVGIGEPYSLIISAQWVEHLTPVELRFLIGRELAHVEAGHTRITSLLSINGRENALVSVLFGAWLRRIEYTADRAGLLCGASLEGALSAISVSTFHLVGRTIDLSVFAEQQREIDAERSLRIGEWTSSTPYATRRIAALRAFAREPLFLTWSMRFEQHRFTPYEPPPVPAGAVARRAYANFPRRLSAFCIDAIVLQAIVPNLPLGPLGDTAATTAKNAPHVLPAIAEHATILYAATAGGLIGAAITLAYVVLLVGLANATLGMMVMDLRVVTDRFERIGVVRAVARYVCFIASFAAVVGFLRMLSRVQPFEKWSGTRLIAGSAYARYRDGVMAQPFEAAMP